MHNRINISENASARIRPLYGNYDFWPPNISLRDGKDLNKSSVWCVSRLCSTCVIIRVITGRIAAAHSPGVPLSASTEANIASMRAWTALFTLFCSSALESSGLVGMTTDNPAYQPLNVELQIDLK